MSDLQSTIDARTKLAGSNKMEILLFNLGGNEKFAINVFKIHEITRVTTIRRAPNMPYGMEGLVSLRGRIMPAINLAKFLDTPCDGKLETMVVAEYSNHILGLIVKDVDQIVRVDWDTVHAATEGMSSDKGAFVTAVTELPDGRLISILDVEKVLEVAFGKSVVGEVSRVESANDMCVFFADDSSVARTRILEVLGKMGVNHIQAVNGKEAWERLSSLAAVAESSKQPLRSKIQVILTDAEMPEMDGYVLTQNIKADSRFDGIPVVMHSSLSSEANKDLGKKVGVDYYVPKFDGGMLANALRPLLG